MGLPGSGVTEQNQGLAGVDPRTGGEGGELRGDAGDDVGVEVGQPLARRRHRRVHCLPDRAPVHPIPVGQLPDRRSLDPAVLPDLLKQLHSRPRHSRTSAPTTPTRKSETRVGPELVTTRRPTTTAVTTQAGPQFVKKDRPAGASSGDPLRSDWSGNCSTRGRHGCCTGQSDG